MRRRRLLAYLLVATAIITSSAAAQVDEAARRADAAAAATSTAAPLRARDVAVAPTSHAHGTGLFGLRSTRSTWLERLLGSGAAFLSGAALLAALQRRRAVTQVAAPSSLWFASVPLGRGPPHLAAI